MGLLSDLKEYKKITSLIPKCQRYVYSSKDILDEYSTCTNPPFDIDINSIYQIWGSDYIVEKDLSVKCLEINAFPIYHMEIHMVVEKVVKKDHMKLNLEKMVLIEI